ncbi:hypothetical protein D3C78_1590450 [compost metagenome]
MRVIAVEADHVDSDVTALGHQLVDLLLVGGNHFVLSGARLDLRRGLPAVEAYALLGQGRGDVFEMGQHLVGDFRAGDVIDGQAAHQGNSLTVHALKSERIFNSHSNKNSKASICRRASLMRAPQVYRPWPRIR